MQIKVILRQCLETSVWQYINGSLIIYTHAEVLDVTDLELSRECDVVHK